MHQNLSQGQKNPRVPGARIIGRADAWHGYDAATATDRLSYPVTEVNDLAVFQEVSSTGTQGWTIQSHPNVTAYLYILDGRGSIELGTTGSVFIGESYDFGPEDLVIVPRDIPYRISGSWSGLFFHYRTSAFGRSSGPNRFPHPVRTWDAPERPAEEASVLAPAGTLRYLDPLGLTAQEGGPAASELVLPRLRDSGRDAAELYAALTPDDRLTADAAASGMAGRNPSVLGSRIVRRTDAPDVYNANAGNRQWSYPLSWVDDTAIFIGSKHLASSDEERPFDSHSHPHIEEYKYILAGSGTISFGVGDDTFETETYAFTQGDLVITPRGIPHYDGGDFMALNFHAKTSTFGVAPGTPRTPHPAYVYTKPPRPTPEEEAALNEPGTLLLMDSREELLLYLPNPILRTGRHPTEMTWLRPDLFEDAQQ